MASPEVVQPEMPASNSTSTDDYGTARPSKVRFKLKRRSDDDHDREKRSSKRRRRDDEDRDHAHRHKHHHYSSRRHKTSHRGPTDEPAAYDDTYLPNSRSERYENPNEAFREALFDALADDEGAAYWEGVYGQPMHIYPNVRETPQGELEQMTDDEYATYVRAEMYKKSHEYIFEERARREEERKKQKERDKAFEREARKWRDDHEDFVKQTEEALRRKRARQAAVKPSSATGKQQDPWERYTTRWEELKSIKTESAEEDEEKKLSPFSTEIPWPVQSGKRKDVSHENVDKFFHTCPPEALDLGDFIKLERVRWHPDKMQHRFGKQGIDTETIKSVTVVFQATDKIWSELRDKKSKSRN